MQSDKRHVLVIDDDEEMRCLLTDFLTEEGYEADSVEKGVYGLRRIMSEHFDLIITDIRMPTFSGLDLLPELKRNHPGTPVIVITAFGSEEIFLKALSRGADAYLEKPIQLHRLKTLLQEMMASGPSRLPQRRIPAKGPSPG